MQNSPAAEAARLSHVPSETPRQSGWSIPPFESEPPERPGPAAAPPEPAGASVGLSIRSRLTLEDAPLDMGAVDRLFSHVLRYGTVPA